MPSPSLRSTNFGFMGFSLDIGLRPTPQFFFTFTEYFLVFFIESGFSIKNAKTYRNALIDIEYLCGYKTV